MEIKKNISDLEIRFVIKPSASGVPSAEQRCKELFSFSQGLQGIGMTMQQWFIDGDSTKPAFNRTGPTQEFIASVDDDNDDDSPTKFASVWIGWKRGSWDNAGIR